MNPLKGKNIVVGITGSIAAYKAAEVASTLTKAGAIVFPVLTPSGEKFVTPLTLHSVTGRHASTDKDLWESDQHVTHIFLGHEADLILITPASANFMAKMAHGLGDSLLALTVLASHCPVLIAPAMDGDMYQNKATQANIQILKERGFHFIGPDAGHLASGMTGTGRMTNPQNIVSMARYILSRSEGLKGKRVLVSAGGTQEPIDPVRFITNRSSGKQGYAIAQAALDRGAQVTLVSAPTSLTPPVGAEIISVRTAAEMESAVLNQLSETDALIMCAAVADFRPIAMSAEKIKKSDQKLVFELEPTTDILNEVGKRRADFPNLRIVAGFAAESQNLIENAQKKLMQKRLDWIVANDISSQESGFEVDRNQGIVLFSDGSNQPLSLMDKTAIAEALMTIVEDQLSGNN